MIRKIPQQPREPAFIDIDDIREFSWIEPLQKIIEERLNEPDYKTIWYILKMKFTSFYFLLFRLTSTKVRNNGTLGVSLCFVEENLKFNRFRTLADISVRPENRDGPSKVDMNSQGEPKMTLFWN